MQAGLPSFVLSTGEWLVQLNNVAITQMRSLVENKKIKMLK